MDIYYINGEFIDDEDARISAKDIIVLRGFGVFDFLVTYNKRPFYLKEHVKRLENSAKEIGLKLLHTTEEICKIVQETIDRNPHHDESNVRIVYTGGVSPDGVTPQGNGVLMVMVTPKLRLPDWWYTDGASIITVDIERFIPTAKSTNYLSAVSALQKAHKTGAVEAVYVDRNQRVLEGTTTNIFGIKGTTIITPPDSILPGITRGIILKLIPEDLKLEMRHMELVGLLEMDEIFISASNKEIVPVIKVNDITIASGRPGEKTKQIMAFFKAVTTDFGIGKISKIF
ncbi:aminotransferase class IV [Desulfobacula sp.]|uniref:aminotransferase class IV n=1 Tax=Desulfobacula sp. TaxID=2593537 RepID=UPI0025BB5BFC|nr:aminotransferase class IV [Desulfobacula sp.]MBC2703549.1 aminotransferase class IV [Desulfobacula sp.]